jgi:hypothetical protein
MLRRGLHANRSDDCRSPAGEADFLFSTAGGPVGLRPTGDALTPDGGLVPWAALTRHTGIVERLAATCPVTRTSPNAKPVHDILHSFLLTALVDGRRFAHVERLREDPTMTGLFGLQSVVATTRSRAPSVRSTRPPAPRGSPEPRRRSGVRCPSG